jgi:hypothetical protein
MVTAGRGDGACASPSSALGCAPMPVPQLTPPGHLDQHGLLVALTPVVLCLVTAGVVWLIGERRSGSNRAVRVLAALNLGGALALQALFLLPWGPAAAYTEPLAGGLVRVGWIETGSAFTLGCWAAWYWRPWSSGSTAARWSLRVALGLALPVVALPALAIAAFADVSATEGRRAWLASALAIVVTGVILVVPGLSATCHWWLHGMTLAGCVVLAGRGPWAIPLLIATIAALRIW